MSKQLAKQNSSGFSLVQVLVGIGITGILLLGSMAGIDLVMRSGLNNEQRQAVQQLNTDIYNLLENQETCRFNFGTHADNPTAVKNVNLFPVGTALDLTTPLVRRDPTTPLTPIIVFQKYDATSGAPLYINNLLRITSFELVDFAPLSGAFGLATLRYRVEKNQASIGANDFQKRQIRLKIKLTADYDPMAAANNIEYCIATGGPVDHIWIKQPSGDIYYNDGKVGIGTENPISRLHVKGSTIRVERVPDAVSGPAYDFYQDSLTHLGQISAVQSGATGSSLYFYTKPVAAALNASGPEMVINDLGNVGIGTTAPTTHLSIDSRASPTEMISMIKPDTSANTDIISPYNGSSDLQSGAFQYGVQPTTDSWVISKRETGDPGWQQLLTVNKNGRVGVGASSPQANMHIYKSGAPVRLSVHNPEEFSVFFELAGTGGIGGSEGFEMEYKNNGDTVIRNRFYNPAILEGNIYFQTNTSTVFGGVVNDNLTIHGNGNVGIGTVAPQENLHIKQGAANGAVRIEGLAPLVRFFDNDHNTKFEMQLSDNKFTFGPTDGTWGWIHADGTPSSEGVVVVNRQGDMMTEGCVRANRLGTFSDLGTCLSDQRLKQNIADYPLGLEELLNLRPRIFRFNGLGGTELSSGSGVGFIAQEVEELVPDLVGITMRKLHNTDKEATALKTVNYSTLPYVLINAVKQVYKQLQKIAAKVDRLFHDINSTNATVTTLQDGLRTLEAENQALRTYICKSDPHAELCR